MPRGSKPGERRGGRNAGTPNKKTVLKSAAICAAAADPNVSPLDFLLGLMRDPKLEIEVRVSVAEVALPFFHAKPKPPCCIKPATTKYGAPRNRVNVRGPEFGTAHTEAVKISAPAPEGASGADLLPLDFLLGVMRGPDTLPHLRIRVAAALAPYLYPKMTARAEITVDDPYGFNIDPAVAWAISEAADDSYLTVESPAGVPHIADEKLAKLEPHLADGIKALTCPDGYGLKEATSDLFRLQGLAKGKAKTEEKDAEKVHLLARLWAYKKSPEAFARARLAELEQLGASQTAIDQGEIFYLAPLYPEPPLDRGHPRYRELERARLMQKQEKERRQMVLEQQRAHFREAYKTNKTDERIEAFVNEQRESYEATKKEVLERLEADIKAGRERFEAAKLARQ
jgi:hypothetical protein